MVEPVNFNAPGQTVIAGNATAVARAIEAAKARGAKRAVLLPVSVPSHSSLMLGAAERLAGKLATVDVRMPNVADVYTVDVRKHTSRPTASASRSRSSCSSPCAGPTPCARCSAGGATTFVECGPGKVLTSLNRRIERKPDLKMLALDDPASIAAALAACGDNRMSSLAGEFAFVTGATRGIGRAIALELGRRGARVVGTATTAAGAAGHRCVPRRSRASPGAAWC